MSPQSTEFGQPIKAGLQPESQERKSGTRTMQKAFYTNEFCDWPTTISVNVSECLRNQIDEASAIIAQSHFIRMIDIDVPDGFLEDNDWHYGCTPVDVDKIIVAAHGDFYYYVQCKWDSRVQAEYCVEL